MIYGIEFIINNEKVVKELVQLYKVLVSHFRHFFNYKKVLVQLFRKKQYKNNMFIIHIYNYCYQVCYDIFYLYFNLIRVQFKNIKVQFGCLGVQFKNLKVQFGCLGVQFLRSTCNLFLTIRFEYRAAKGRLCCIVLLLGI
jgi:hypothetical protein